MNQKQYAKLVIFLELFLEENNKNIVLERLGLVEKHSTRCGSVQNVVLKMPVLPDKVFKAAVVNNVISDLRSKLLKKICVFLQVKDVKANLS